MKIKLSAYHTQNILTERTYNPNFEVKEDLSEIDNLIEQENYCITLNQKWFEGIHISTIEIVTHEEQDFYYESSQHHIDFLFCLEGRINYYSAEKAAHLFTLHKNQQNISFGQLNRVVFNVAGKVSLIFIQLTEAYFSKITNQEFKSPAKFIQEAITPEIKLLLRSLNGKKYCGRVKRIFLESKIFELIICYMESRNALPASLKEDDLRKILLAKQLIESNLRKPGSLLELSRRAGINDYKLKKGFKALTGYTVFGYLYKIRMEKAHYFLLQEKKTVNEVAFLVGYKNAQHFISAFKKQYEVLPGSLNKT